MVAAARLDEVLAYGEGRMRAALGHLPDGEVGFEDVLDSFGPAPAQLRPITIRLAVRLEGEHITFDFTGTDPQQPGNMNAVAAVTASSVAFALRSAVAPTLPANGGSLRPVTIVAPPGSVVDARPPAAVGAGNVEVSQRVADVCFGALALIVPGRVGAGSQGTMNNVLIGGVRRHPGVVPVAPESAWVYYETVGGGQGGRPGRVGTAGFRTAVTKGGDGGRGPAVGVPGQSGIHTNMTSTKNAPIEALEQAFPMRVLRQRLRRGSGGAGWSSGGEGIERDLQVLVDATVSRITERRVSQPWGLAGGEPAAVAGVDLDAGNVPRCPSVAGRLGWRNA